MPTHIRTRVLQLLGSVLLGLAFLPSMVSAITVSPVLFDNTVDPGQKVMGTIRLFNETQGTQTYYASVQNFVASGEEGQQSFLPESESYGLAKWIELDQPSVTLNAGQSKDFAWAINVPSDAEPGGQYAAIFFSTTPPANENSGIGIGAKTGVLMLVNVNGNVKEAATLESFKTVHQEDLSNDSSFYDRLPVLFETRIQNDGSVHFAPTGRIYITDMFGHAVTDVDMNPDQSRVLPNSVRRVRAVWGTETTPPTSFLGELQAEWNGLAFGRYTARLDGFYGKQRQELQGSTTFWVIPWRLLLVGLVGLIILLLLVRGYNRMVIAQAAKRSSEAKKVESAKESS